MTETSDQRSLFEIYEETLRVGQRQFLVLKDLTVRLPGPPNKPCACWLHTLMRLDGMKAMLSRKASQRTKSGVEG